MPGRFEDNRPRGHTSTGKDEQTASLVEQGVIKPDDCCHLCKGGWCTDEVAALTCKDALLPDDFGETVDHSGIGCQRGL